MDSGQPMYRRSRLSTAETRRVSGWRLRLPYWGPGSPPDLLFEPLFDLSYFAGAEGLRPFDD